jgi:hypothetical protein
LKHLLVAHWFLPISSFAKSQVWLFTRKWYLSWIVHSHYIMFSFCKAFDNVKTSSMLVTMQMKSISMLWGALLNWIDGSFNGRSILLAIILFLFNNKSSLVNSPSPLNNWSISTP